MLDFNLSGPEKTDLERAWLNPSTPSAKEVDCTSDSPPTTAESLLSGYSYDINGVIELTIPQNVSVSEFARTIRSAAILRGGEYALFSDDLADFFGEGHGPNNQFSASSATSYRFSIQSEDKATTTQGQCRPPIAIVALAEICERYITEGKSGVLPHDETGGGLMVGAATPDMVLLYLTGVGVVSFGNDFKKEALDRVFAVNQSP